MAKQCIGCGKKLGLFSLKKLMTKDNEFICDSCKEKLFPQSGKLGKAIFINDWISKQTSVVLKHYLNEGKQLTIDSSGNVEGQEIFCPYCGSENVQPLGQHHKSFSAGKAAVGAALTGGVGLAAGLLGKNTKQTDFVCMDCGKQFKK